MARGFSQRKGFDYQETYSPVVKLITVCILLAIATQKDLHIHQMDVKSAFLNGDLNEEIYMRQPEGFVQGDNVCLLLKSLYGLKQSARKWYERFHEFIRKLGFIRSEYDYCLYYKVIEGSVTYLLLYVDDLLLLGKDLNEILRIKKSMSKEFEMKDTQEMKHFLGITIERDIAEGTLKISQRAYLEAVLKRFGMDNCNGISTPMEHGLNLPKQRKNKLLCHTENSSDV